MSVVDQIAELMYRFVARTQREDRALMNELQRPGGTPLERSGRAYAISKHVSQNESARTLALKLVEKMSTAETNRVRDIMKS